MKRIPLIVLSFVFIIGFWIWFQKVLERERSLPVKKEVIYEIKKRISEIETIARKGSSYEDVIKEAKNAIFHLTFIGSPAASYLIKASADKKKPRFARIIYLQILGVIESKEAIDHIAELLKNDKDYLIRMQCAISLGIIKDERVILPLKDGLSDKEMIVKVACATSLIKMGREDLVKDAIKNDEGLKMYLEKWQNGL